ncbi:MAG: ThuA domain-containing protein, partial [Bacteroidota bacterium]
YVGIPLRYYDYLKGDADWAINADFIQGHYEMPTATPLPVPLQQVDVRGGFTAAAGANFYTAKNYPEAYQNQMYVNEPTGHIVHLARVVRDGAGYKELKDGNIFASTDAWTAPVFSKTGPDGNLWVADWYNPVIQHNPDKRGMENQIWNDDKGEGNAHLNEHRDKRHGRIYIITHEDGNDPDIQNLDSNDGQLLLAALQSDNMFWRTTAQRLLVEENKTSLIPELLKMARTGIENPKDNTQYGTLHALWTLEGLGAYDTHQEALALVFEALSKGSFSTKKAAIALLPQTTKSSNALAASGLLGDTPLALRLDAMLKAGELPETNALYKQMEAVASDSVTAKDKWLTAALKIYRKEQNEEFVEPDKVRLILPAADQGQVTWRSTQKRPTDTWMNPNFDDSRWKRGKGLFGGEDSKDPQTPWTTSDIWLRADFILREPMVDPVLKIKNDDSCEIYINGLLVKTEEEVNGKYTYVKLPKETESYFKVGHNHIAVHAHDKGGKRYIDVGVGTVKAIQPDITFRLKTVNQKMAFDKTILRAKAGQVVKIVLDNTDQMPHNLVVLQSGTLAAFGERVDDYVKDPKAPQTGYVPNSRYVLGATEMLEPGDNGAVVFELPKVPGSYPFVCTFPGHWQMMQGAILVEAPGSYISEDPDAFASVVMGGGSSHDFEGLFGVADGKVLSNSGKNTVLYIENSATLAQLLKDNDLLMLTNNKPLGTAARKAIFTRVDQGMPLFIYHPSAWYNWEDWPRYNAELVGGGSRSHEKLQEFEVIVVKPEHPIMKGVPKTFRIVDELYRWEQDPEGAAVEVLAVGRGLESGAEFPVVWVVKHPKAKIVGNTLGHDERAHNLPAYKTLLANSLEWAKTRE